MTTTTSQRVFAWFSIVVASLVLLLCLAGIIGTWVGGSKVSTAAVELMVGVEKIAGAGRTSIGGIMTDVGDIRAQVATVGDATTKLSQNVGDKGLIMTLLPEEKEQKLQATAARIKDTFDGIREMLASAFGLYKSINRMPFVSLPMPDQERLASIKEGVDGLQQDVQELRTQIVAIRAGAADAIGKVTGAVTRVNDRLGQIESELTRFDGQLANVQAASVRLQSLIPTIFLVSALAMTLFLAWIIYCQIVIIRLARSRIRSKPA